MIIEFRRPHQANPDIVPITDIKVIFDAGESLERHVRVTEEGIIVDIIDNTVEPSRVANTASVTHTEFLETRREARQYILYDGRACGGQGTDNASVLEACDSDEEAQEAKGDYGQMACYSYRLEPDGKTLVDERWEWDYHP